MRTMCSREIFTKKCWQQQIFDSDLKGAWHYNHVTFTPIAKNFMLHCRLIYMLSILCVRLTIKVKVGIPESFKVGWYPLKKTGSSHLNTYIPTINTEILPCLNTPETPRGQQHNFETYDVFTEKRGSYFSREITSSSRSITSISRILASSSSTK